MSVIKRIDKGRYVPIMVYLEKYNVNERIITIIVDWTVFRN